MTEEPTGKSLSRREFDAVIRRAAELSTTEGTGEGSLTELELFRIAREVGLGEEHVRRALGEVRSGGIGGSTLDRIFGPLYVRASRVVPGTPRELSRKLDDFLVGTQLLQSVRRGQGVLQYRPAVDWASQIARAASFSSKKYYLASAKSVEVHLDELEDETTRVEFVVDPGTRGDALGGAAFGGGFAGLITGGFTAGPIIAATSVVAPAVVLGVVVGAGVTAGVTYSVGRAHKKKLVEVQSEIEGVLDSLEFGESLEPPPASWRRWVKRHFHGVARDLMKDEGDV